VFIVYTSNIFAILGLRALYFLLAGSLMRFRFLNEGLAVVLGFVGVKMLIGDWYHIPPLTSLSVVGTILGIALLASLIWPGEVLRHPPEAVRYFEPPSEEQTDQSAQSAPQSATSPNPAEPRSTS
jgi:predicted tellurium resistance membrane protein TerC